ncbi:exosome complex RNA-binding protein Csl4 [archaeon]|nr:exosome complex RNA-binding protein Csl4 [archaeon]
MVESDDFVLPGTEVGFSEEVMPGDGTYEDDGKIFASITGTVSLDSKERKVTVTPKTSAPPELKNGEIVVGVVWDIRPQVAMIDIVKIKGNERTLPGKISGGLHISKIKDSYVSEISSEIGYGDIVLAKITNANRKPIDLSIVDKELGIIKSYCERCSEPLELKDGKVTCNDCKRTPHKKLSSEYGKGQV